MTAQIYATQVTAYFLAAQAAYQASGGTGTPLNLAGGTVVAGDGNGSVPALSALIAANGVTHEVWRGQTVTSVTVDPNNANQLDIGCDIPAAIGGAEIGPFTVTEFAILDALGNCCIVGTTNLQKTVSSQGQTSDLAWIAAVAYSVAGSVNLTAPSAGFTTLGAVVSAYNANLPDCVAPLAKTDTTQSNGWLKRVFGIAPASQPADTVTPISSAAAMGAGRPASAAEYAVGAPTSGGFAWPWPTLQQVAAEFASVMSAIAALGTSLSGYLLKSGGTMTGPLALAADPVSAMQAATKEYVDNAVAAAEAANPFTTTGVGAIVEMTAAPTSQTAMFDNSLIGVTSAIGIVPNAGLSMTAGGIGWSGWDARWMTSAPPGEWQLQALAPFAANVLGRWIRIS
jgi:hypothetical protein